MIKVEVDKNGTKLWYNDDGQFHREDDPAIECTTEEKQYWVNGKRLSEQAFEEQFPRQSVFKDI